MYINGRELKVPIIQGGMGIGVSLSRLAGSVAKEGGIGVISSVNAGYADDDFLTAPVETNLKALKREIKKAREISEGNGFIGVNIMTAVSHYEETCKAAVDAGADLIISGAGLPLKLPEYTKKTKTLCAPIISSARAAKVLLAKYKKQYDCAPDMLIIEGAKAGGHLGFSVSELIEESAKDNEQILSEVLALEEVKEKQIPVFVAGGVFDGKDLSRYKKLGAAGVQMATRFIATIECDASELFKKAIVAAKKAAIKIINSPVGMPARAIYSPLIKRLEQGESFRAIKCNGCLTACPKNETIPYCISRALIAAVKGDWENGLFFTGSNAFRIDRICSVHELMSEIMEEYQV